MKARKKELVPVGFDWPRRRRMDLIPAAWEEGFPALRMPGFAGMGEPVVDVFDAGKEMVVTAELPGTKKEDISIKVTGEVINLTVKRRERAEERREDRRRGFYSYSSSSRFEGYSRSIPFGTAVNAKAAKATYKNGVLEIRVPKTAGKRPGHAIEVE
ncbi:MAG: Hsp20/alpha crystallin family protein [Candidatus Micrarchaeota archaeon]